MKINVKEEKIVVSTDIHIQLENKEDVQLFKDLLTYAGLGVSYSIKSWHTHDALSEFIDTLNEKIK